MTNILSQDRVTFSEKVLDVLRVAVQSRVSRTLLADSKFSIYDSLDFTGQTLTVAMERSLLADKVLSDYQNVPFGSYVDVDIDTTRWGLKWWCIPVRKVRTDTHRRYVWGTVRVQCDYFRTFPLANIAYPQELGQFWKWQELKVADVKKKGQRDNG